MGLSALGRIGGQINRDNREFDPQRDTQLVTTAKGATDFFGIPETVYSQEMLDAIERYRQENPLGSIANTFVGENSPLYAGTKGATAVIKSIPFIASQIANATSNAPNWVSKALPYTLYLDDAYRLGKAALDERLWKEFGNKD